MAEENRVFLGILSEGIFRKGHARVREAVWPFDF